MGKFFKQEPKQCSICGETSRIVKSVWKAPYKFLYCQKCWDKTYGIAKQKIMTQVKTAKQNKKGIGMKDLKKVSDEIIKEL